jgi:hypothetical protein
MEQDERSEEDDFWKVALDSNATANECWVVPSNFDEDEIQNDPAVGLTSKCVIYNIPLLQGPVTLKLYPLPPTDGIWGPLGAQAWFGSALLTAILLQPESRIQQHLDEVIAAQGGNINSLELGSGAVGLSGLALALILAERQGSRHRVYLTDNESHVLQQLEYNVKENVARIHKEHTAISLPVICVLSLDWNDSDIVDTGLERQLNLVVGSELVYTKETAEACATIVRSLVEQSPNVLIVIVQVRDRDGWNNSFLPNLRRDGTLCVQEEALTDASLHETACNMIRHGGNLDRFDYGVCYVQSTQANSLS